jgi:hypothetical protein
VLIEEPDQVAPALLVSAQCRQVGAELLACAEPLVTVPDLGEQGGDLLVDGIAGQGPERLIAPVYGDRGARPGWVQAGLTRPSAN